MIEKDLILVCRDKLWNNREVIKDRIAKLPRNVIIIHGMAKGADLTAALVAKNRGLVVKGYAARWNTFGGFAGPIRDIEMLNLNPKKVIAFRRNDNRLQAPQQGT